MTKVTCRCLPTIATDERRLRRRLEIVSLNAIALLMPKPYSYDLRHAVIQAIRLDGLKISEASIIFNRLVHVEYRSEAMLTKANCQGHRAEKYAIEATIIITILFKEWERLAPYSARERDAPTPNPIYQIHLGLL